MVIQRIISRYRAQDWTALSSDTFEELRSTGNLGLLRDEKLKAALFEYYRFDEGQRQYQSLQLMTEIRHFEFAAKLPGQAQDFSADAHSCQDHGQSIEATVYTF